MRQAVRAARLLAERRRPPAAGRLARRPGCRAARSSQHAPNVAKLNASSGPTRHRRAVDGHLRAHEAAFGITDATLGTLVFVRDYVSIDGTHHLAWMQRRAGIDVYGAGCDQRERRTAR